MSKTATASHTFSTRLYDKLAAVEVGQNLFLSPFSIQVALAMCAVGARGETRKVLADLIGAPHDIDRQNRQYAGWIRSVNGEGERPFQLVTANALWGQEGYQFNADFKKAIADFYDGAFNEVNYITQPDAAVQRINDWVSQKTQEKIRDLIRRHWITPDTCLILTNAIYFKGAWDEPFQEVSTRDQEWYGPGGTGNVPMMHQSGGYLYHEGDGFQAIDLPYQGEQLSMLVVLPRARDGLAALETRWIEEGLYQRVIAGLDHQETVVVSLPRFRIEKELELESLLCALGAKVAFSSAADFSGIGKGPLAISKVVHKAFLEVNEAGTEAAAATAVLMLRSCARRSARPKVFQADHPFLFFIRDRKTNAVLFSGRLLEPK